MIMVILCNSFFSRFIRCIVKCAFRRIISLNLLLLPYAVSFRVFSIKGTAAIGRLIVSTGRVACILGVFCIAVNKGAPYL